MIQRKRILVSLNANYKLVGGFNSNDDDKLRCGLKYDHFKLKKLYINKIHN